MVGQFLQVYKWGKICFIKLNKNWQLSLEILSTLVYCVNCYRLKTGILKVHLIVFTVAQIKGAFCFYPNTFNQFSSVVGYILPNYSTISEPACTRGYMYVCISSPGCHMVVFYFGKSFNMNACQKVH